VIPFPEIVERLSEPPGFSICAVDRVNVVSVGAAVKLCRYILDVLIAFELVILAELIEGIVADMFRKFKKPGLY